MERKNTDIVVPPISMFFPHKNNISRISENGGCKINTLTETTKNKKVENI